MSQLKVNSIVPAGGIPTMLIMIPLFTVYPSSVNIPTIQSR